MDRILEMEKKELWIDKRYVEVFKSTAEEMEYVLEKAERQANQDRLIRNLTKLFLEETMFYRHIRSIFSI